jgi:hypothetical protein
MNLKIGMVMAVSFFTRTVIAQQSPYPQNYFRHPLNIPMQLVANFGEIRTNHWHMGLDIRTQQKVNLPVYAAADGYISRVSVEPGGFGQAIYIDHPNGYTTLYGHLNAFFPALDFYVRQKQYEQESWKVNLVLPKNLFKVAKGDLIAYSGSTGASEGPHVHFEIRDTKTENCLNPLLFGFPIADNVPPTLIRLALYDRNRSTYAQSPQILALKKSGSIYSVTGNSIRTGSNRISFAIGAVDRLSGTNNPNGIYSAQVFMDGKTVSGFALDDISYDDTRYINAQLDYPFKTRGGNSLQHITPLPGANDIVYTTPNGDGVISLNDSNVHEISIEVKDANFNTSVIRFSVKFDASLSKPFPRDDIDKLLPNNLNIFERDNFELFTTEKSIYDTVRINYSSSNNGAANAVSSLFSFLDASIPSHDSITVRIKMNDIPAAWTDRIIIKNTCGTKTFYKKAGWQKNAWIAAKFRQFGTYQAFVDTEPPTINNPPADLSRSTRIVFTPHDNFEVIKNFRVEVDGQWLRFTNDKGKTWIYTFDDKFPKGEHELRAIIEDEAGNITTRTWTVSR